MRGVLTFIDSTPTLLMLGLYGHFPLHTKGTQTVVEGVKMETQLDPYFKIVRYTPAFFQPQVVGHLQYAAQSW